MGTQQPLWEEMESGQIQISGWNLARARFNKSDWTRNL